VPCGQLFFFTEMAGSLLKEVQNLPFSPPVEAFYDELPSPSSPSEGNGYSGSPFFFPRERPIKAEGSVLSSPSERDAVPLSLTTSYPPPPPLLPPDEGLFFFFPLLGRANAVSPAPPLSLVKPFFF